MNITNIVVATDFSEASEAALASALRLAQRLDAAIHILHVVENGLPAGLWFSEVYRADVANLQTTLVREAEERLHKDVAWIEQTKVRVTSGVQLGPAASTIVEVARQRGDGLIVTGTHGRTGLPHLLLGSVAERIVRTAPCPVLTVRLQRPGLRRIVVATDFGPAADAALHYGASLTATFGASLHLVHIVEDPFPTGGDPYIRSLVEIREHLMQNARLQLADSLAPLTAINATSGVIEGTPARGITDIAARKDADLIVMGTHGRSAVAHFVMGSVADRVMRTAPCPVLTVRAADVTATAEPLQTASAGARV